MEVLETTWTSAGPLNHKVTTPMKSGEAEDVWHQRHKTTVDGMKLLYPPI